MHENLPTLFQYHFLFFMRTHCLYSSLGIGVLLRSGYINAKQSCNSLKLFPLLLESKRP